MWKRVFLRGSAPRIVPSLRVGGCLAAIFAILVVATCYVGANYVSKTGLIETYRQPNGDEVFCAYAIDYARDSNESNDVIFVGDSTCRCGVDPRHFEKLTGRKSYNLGTFGVIGVVGTPIIVRTYLEHHSPPRMVVFCVSPVQSLRMPSNPSPRMVADGLRERFLRTYGLRSQCASVFQGGIDSLAYYVRRGTLVSGTVAREMAGFGRVDRLGELIVGLPQVNSYHDLVEKQGQSRGYFHLPFNPVGRQVLPEPANPHAILDDFDRSTRELARLADEHGFRLLLRFTPLPMDKTWDVEILSGWVRQLQNDFPRVVAGRPKFLWYPRDLCWDDIHISTAGVEKFTAQIASEIAAIFPSEHRAALDPQSAEPTRP